MTQKKLSFPKQWEDWASWILGIWLLLSPWALFFEYEPTAVRNAVVLGLLIILMEVVELSVFRDWEEWINIILGIWLVTSPWALGIASTAARWNFIIVGALVLVLALHEIRNMRSDPDKESH
jgi:SPW repeat